MNKDREKSIQWVLDFLSSDLGEVGKGDFEKLRVELNEVLLPKVDFGPQGGIPEDVVKNIQAALVECWNRYMVPVLSGTSNRSDDLPPVPQWGERFFFVGDKGQFYLGATDTKISDQAVERFIQLLSEGSPVVVEHFRVCDECQRWFFSIRPKRFCTARCNWRFNARKKRGEPGTEKREQYNQYQAKVMKKKYRQEKLGGE